MNDIDLEKIKSFPFQTQISYTALDGSKCLRVITQSQEVCNERDEVEEITSMRQVKELLAQMRNCFLKLKQDGKNILEAETLLAGDGAADSEKNGLKLAPGEPRAAQPRLSQQRIRCVRGPRSLGLGVHVATPPYVGPACVLLHASRSDAILR